MTTTNPKVDAFVNRAKKWGAEIQKIRSILLECGLDEELKWGKPCYAVDGKNVAIIQPFEPHCALMFFKGALLKDTHGLLRRQGEHSQSAMRLEFNAESPVVASKVKAYVKQAIELEKAGLSVKPAAAPGALDLPDELTARLKKDRALAAAFKALTPGRQRAYVIHVSGAKQATTRAARIEKCVPR